jgi:DNA (cytosine-5)-methyltransferase 1
MPTLPHLTVSEFFAGIGLMRLGLEEAGWSTVFANDLDEKKREMYEHHFGHSPAVTPDDIHSLDVVNVPSTVLATASFPCNDLSLAGARRGLAGEHSSAFWGFIRILEEMGARRPPLILLENVTGFLTSNDGADFREALLAVNRLGYSVDAFIIDAARFVPQSRQRLFVVGQRNAATPQIAETPSLLQSELRPAALADFILWHPDVQWNLRSLPPLPRRGTQLSDIIEDLSPNSTAWWNKQRCDYLLNQMSAKHRAQADTMIHAPHRSYATVFRRVRATGSMAELRTDGIAGCLRTPRGGSGRQILFVAGKGRFAVRLLTARECARLMGADDFRLDVPLNQALFGFGDAVCVPAVKWIADNYLTPLATELHVQAKETSKQHRTVRYGGTPKNRRTQAKT